MTNKFAKLLSSRAPRPSPNNSTNYDNGRENIDPHLKTKVIDTKEIVQNGVQYDLSTIGVGHVRQHSITQTLDHTSTATTGKILKADANGLPIDATNTDTDVASAVSLKHGVNDVNTSSAAASHTHVGITSNDDLLDQQIQEMEIVEDQAGDSRTHIAKRLLIADTCSDTSGYLNTITVGGATTATFDTNKYKRANSGSSTVSSMASDSTNVGSTAHYGLKISTNMACTLTAVTKYNLNTSTKAYLYNGVGDTLLDTQTFSGDVATFNYALSNATSYVILTGKDGGAYNSRYGNAPSFPYNGTQINIIHDMLDPTTINDSYAFNIASFTTAIAETSKIVEVSLGTFSGTVTHTQLVYNGAAESGASVTYKLIDSSAASDDALALNTKNALVNCDGTKITGGKIQIQLNPKSSSPTDGNPYIYSYCLRLFKS
jgi:hypothetical protein